MLMAQYVYNLLVSYKHRNIIQIKSEKVISIHSIEYIWSLYLSTVIRDSCRPYQFQPTQKINMVNNKETADIGI